MNAYIYIDMNGAGKSKLITAIFMIGIIMMTLFLPGFNAVKKSTYQKSYRYLVKNADDCSSGCTSQNSNSVNLIEEEVEYTTEESPQLEISLPVPIEVSFFSPNLFFKEHFLEVSGPPPWA